jgi:hypothetical protein
MKVLTLPTSFYSVHLIQLQACSSFTTIQLQTRQGDRSNERLYFPFYIQQNDRFLWRELVECSLVLLSENSNANFVSFFASVDF